VTQRPADADERADLVKELVATWAGIMPLHVERMTMGHHHLTFDVRLPDRALIVRTNSDKHQLRHTADNLAALRALGLPAPQVVGSDLMGATYPWAYLILERLPGRDLFFELDGLNDSQIDRIGRQLVDYQQRVATLPLGSRFGWAPIGQPAQYASWTQLLFDKLDRHLGVLGSRAPEELVRRLTSTLTELEPYFETVQPQPFLDDLTTRNVLIESGEVTGVVDFDVIGYGDPLLWLGLAQMAVTSGNHPHAARTYTSSIVRAWGITTAAQRVLDTYTALFGLDFASETQRVTSEEVSRHVRLAEVFLERTSA
jgi:aminoglycoside phosphotransferase (APT) family kinase protein